MRVGEFIRPVRVRPLELAFKDLLDRVGVRVVYQHRDGIFGGFGLAPGQGKESPGLQARKDFEPVVHQPQGLFLNRLDRRTGQNVVELGKGQVLHDTLEIRRRVGQ